MESKTKEKLIKKLKEIGVVKKRRVNLKHAGISNFYVDIKKAYGEPKILAMLSKAVWRQIDKNITCVAAAGYGGIPLAAAVSGKYGLKLVLVREKPKEHGMNVWIDGYMPKKGDKVWIVDDVLTTGKSIKHIIKVIKKTDAKIFGCSIVVKRGDGQTDIPLFHILGAEDLL